MKINEAIGQFLKDYRTKHGYTLEQIATASQRYGSGWSAATILSMEKGGSRADALPNILLLVQSLNDLRLSDEDTGLIKRELTVGDLLYGADSVVEYDGSEEIVEYGLRGGKEPLPVEDDYVQITDDLKVLYRDLGDAFDDVTVNLPEWGTPMTEQTLAESSERERKSKELTRKVVEHYSPNLQVQWDSPLWFFGVADNSPSAARAAEKLGLEPYACVNVICLAVYGHSLDAEARKRAGDGSNQQKRGRMTRKIVEELRELLEKAEHGQL